VLGETGRFQGRDYRGVEVLADLRAVAGTDWFVVTKMDIAEVDAEAWAMAVVTVLLVLLAIVVIGGLAVIAYVARSHALQGRLLAAERERSTAVQRYNLLFQQARDAVILFDASRRVVEANVAAETLYGWTRDELIGMCVDDLRTPETRAATVRDWEDSRMSGGTLFETVHRRRDGTEVPVEVSSREIEIDGKAYRQSSIRDITQRKGAEDEMRGQLEELRRWSTAVVGRERRIIALKLEVNQLLLALGREPRYEAEPIDGEDEDA
jgi:PAS domain S-box-containing protein